MSELPEIETPMPQNDHLRRIFLQVTWPILVVGALTFLQVGIRVIYPYTYNVDTYTFTALKDTAHPNTIVILPLLWIVYNGWAVLVQLFLTSICVIVGVFRIFKSWLYRLSLIVMIFLITFIFLIIFSFGLSHFSYVTSERVDANMYQLTQFSVPTDPDYFSDRNYYIVFSCDFARIFCREVFADGPHWRDHFYLPRLPIMLVYNQEQGQLDIQEGDEVLYSIDIGNN